MNLLALDTSTDACTVALAVGGRRAERHAVAPREHSRLLVPMIRELFSEMGVGPDALDAIVLGNGPGSFIGVRIAAAVAQGLASGLGVGIVPVSSLACVAAQAFAKTPADAVAVAQDAHVGEVYLAAFTRGADGLPVACGDARLHPNGTAVDLPDLPEGRGEWQAAGAAWASFPALSAGVRIAPAAVTLPRSGFLLALGEHAWQAGLAVAPGDLVPDYLRQEVARPASVTKP